MVETIFRWWILLCIVCLRSFIPMYVAEYPASKAPTFFLKGFAQDMPTWVPPCAGIFSLIAISHFVWFAVHSGFGVPEILDGQYVIGDRSRILKVLTRAGYITLKEAEARVFATIIISIYFVPMTYWWFRRSHERATAAASISATPNTAPQ